MRTRARAWAIRAVVMTVVTAAGVVGITTPAYAADVVIHSFSMNPPTIDAGQESKARFRIQLNPDEAGSINLTVTSNNSKVECVSGCSIGGAQIKEGGSDFEAVFRANGVFTSEETVTITVEAADVAGGPKRTATQPLRVRATPVVPEVRGTVTDVYTGEPVKDARVTMVDSAGTTWDNIGTGADGSFVIVSVPDKPIAAGQLRFSVRKEGVRDFDSGPIVANPNQALLGVSLRVEVIPTTTPATAPTETQSEETSQAPITTTGAAAAPPPDSGLSGFAIMMIVIGAVLVLAGIGTIVLLFLRRNNEEEGEDGPPGPGDRGYARGGPGRGGPPPPGPRRPGPPDRTQPMRPGYGPRPVAPGARDQTVIARSPLADAPTQIHRPGVPPPPPYGGPGGPGGPGAPGGPPPGGYGPPPGGWTAPGSAPPAPPAGYGPPPQYGAPPAGGPPPAHGPGQPGYGPPPRPGGYAEPRHSARPSEGRRVDWIDD